MTYDSFKAEMAERTGLSEAKVDEVFDAFRDLLHEGAEVNLPKLGELKPVLDKPRSGKSFGREWSTPARMVARFTPFKAYREALLLIPAETPV